MPDISLSTAVRYLSNGSTHVDKVLDVYWQLSLQEAERTLTFPCTLWNDRYRIISVITVEPPYHAQVWEYSLQDSDPLKRLQFVNNDMY